MSGDHPNYWIIVIDQNTEKNPGELRRVDNSNFCGRSSALSDVKNSQSVNNNNNMLQFTQICMVSSVILNTHCFPAVIWAHLSFSDIGWGCKIYRLYLCRGIRPSPISDGEDPMMLELWGLRSTPSLPLLPGPLWPGMVAPDKALSMS